jgi:glycosyltransferase involved in cell wall biosynthesis
VRIIQALGWYFPDSVGGTEVYVSALAKRLVRAGHDVTIAAPDASSTSARTYNVDGVPVFRYPIPARASRDEAQGRVPVRGAQQFHAWLRDCRPDLVHVHTFVTGLGLDEICAARTAGARVVATTHSSSLGFLCQRGTLMRWGDALCDAQIDVAGCAACALHHSGLPRPAASAFSEAPAALAHLAAEFPGRGATALAMTDLIAWNLQRQRSLWAVVDRFVVLSDWARDALMKNGAPPQKLAVNRLGVAIHGIPQRGTDGCHFAAGSAYEGRGRSSADVVRVGYVGRFDPIKGVEDLAGAVAALPRSMPIEVEFRGPASGATERAVRDSLRERFAGDARVSVSEGVQPADVAALLQTYDVICCPSRCLEGGPTIALEAMAVGTPVIAARPGGAAEVVTDGVNGWLVDAGDRGALSYALAQIASRPELIDRWRAALPPIRTMDDVAQDYLELYADVV